MLIYNNFFLNMLCILYRIHKPRRSAAAELPPHLVRITSVHAEREWSFMKIKLFSCQTPHVRACARARCPGHSGNSCATGLRRTADCNCKHHHSLSAPRDERTVRASLSNHYTCLPLGAYYIVIII